MKTFAAVVTLALSLVSWSCQSNNTGGPPPREDLSSMPHNMPASWEGQAGMPGFSSMGGY